MDSSEVGYFLVIVFGLPLLLMLLTGPGMWSEKWGWGALNALSRLWKRKPGAKTAASSDRS